MESLLLDKVSIITGGAVGIGRATALAFAREGAKVVIADILVEEGQETQSLIQLNGGEAHFIRCDVTRAAEVEALVSETLAAYGRLDCAFNNAGIEGMAAPTAECTEENWDQVVAVNLKGVWLCMKYEMQPMLKQRRGVILNTASVAGLVAERGRAAYAAAKGGVIQLTRTAAVEYAGTGLRINAICPGAIMTPMIDRAVTQMSLDNMAPGVVRSPVMRKVSNWFIRQRPMQKMFLNFLQPIGHPGQPGEIAEAVVWMCSDRASFMTGHAMVIDGGMTAA
jgi:NAD(P)-dependent dehydrogenase (short-subunit alcohol dehydrogenase family)